MSKKIGTALKLDDLELVREVKNKPVLWNPENEDYSNQNKRTEAWIDICTKLINNFEYFNEKAKDTIISDAKIDWLYAQNIYYGSLRWTKTKYNPIDTHIIQELKFLDGTEPSSELIQLESVPSSSQDSDKKSSSSTENIQDPGDMKLWDPPIRNSCQRSPVLKRINAMMKRLVLKPGEIPSSTNKNPLETSKPEKPPLWGSLDKSDSDNKEQSDSKSKAIDDATMKSSLNKPSTSLEQKESQLSTSVIESLPDLEKIFDEECKPVDDITMQPFSSKFKSLLERNELPFPKTMLEFLSEIKDSSSVESKAIDNASMYMFIDRIEFDNFGSSSTSYRDLPDRLTKRSILCRNGTLGVSLGSSLERRLTSRGNKKSRFTLSKSNSYSIDENRRMVLEGHVSFLFSLFQWIKNFNEVDKLTFRIKFLESLRKYQEIDSRKKI